jgi:peptidoglycan/LPS O-acetylase OafA/YrhL
MTLYAIWPYFILVLIVLAAMMVRPLFGVIDEIGAAHPRRTTTIDGLRGFLVLSVFVHHLVITRIYIEHGIWDYPPSAFYRLLGQGGVACFFMITGYLFLGKLLDAKGRPDWQALYMGRVFRIGPMYVLAVTVMLLVVACRTGFRLHEPPFVVVSSVLQWLALGIVPLQPEVNGYPMPGLILAGVTWTLFCEWIFYASLPLVAMMVRWRAWIVCIASGWGTCVVVSAAAPGLPDSLVTVKLTPGLIAGALAGLLGFFFSGMLVATLERSGAHDWIRARISAPAGSLIALACLGALFTGFDSIIGPLQIALATAFFYFVCQGSSLFGILTTTGAQRLGNLSYSIYLLQGIALSGAMAIAPLRMFSMQSAAHYWLTGVACALVLVALSTLTYRCIEKPGIAWGKYVLSRLKAAKRARRLAPVQGLGER